MSLGYLVAILLMYTNRWSHYSNHCQWGMASGATCCVGQILYQCKWRQLVAKFVDSLGSSSLWWFDQYALKRSKYVFLSNLTLLSCLGPNSTAAPLLIFPDIPCAPSRFFSKKFGWATPFVAIQCFHQDWMVWDKPYKGKPNLCNV